MRQKNSASADGGPACADPGARPPLVLAEFIISVSLAQFEIPSNLDKLAKGTPAFTIVSECLSVLGTTKDKLTGPNVEYLSNHWSNLTEI